MSEYICNISGEQLARTKLVALDLDGTLFDNNSQITPASLAAINRLTDMGIEVVISTGRPFSGLPFEKIKGSKINYAITSNGAAVWKIDGKQNIFQDTMPDETAHRVLDYVLTKDVHVSAFMNGDGLTPNRCKAFVPRLIVSDSIKESYFTTRVHVEDLQKEIRENDLHIEKITLNFQRDDNGVMIDRSDVADFLAKVPELDVVCGGYMNLEMTKKGVNKGTALHALAHWLGIDPEETMAVGDTENDLPILRAAGISVAMGNAIDAIKAEADIITLANTEDGVACVLNMIRC